MFTGQLWLLVDYYCITEVLDYLLGDVEASDILNLAARNLNISARAYMRSIKVAQTIADLEASPKVTGAHLAEALNYRPNLNVDADTASVKPA